MSKVHLNEVRWVKEDLKDIQGCFVCGLEDGADEVGRELILLTFYNPSTNKSIQVEVDSDGFIFISDPFDL